MSSTSFLKQRCTKRLSTPLNCESSAFSGGASIDGRVLPRWSSGVPIYISLSLYLSLSLYIYIYIMYIYIYIHIIHSVLFNELYIIIPQAYCARKGS